MKKSLIIGVLTSGGDCPGLNAVIRAVVAKGVVSGHKIVGIMDGWRGLIENKTMPLTKNDVTGILQRGGTILGTSRTTPYRKEKDVKTVLANIKKLKLDVVVVIGGEGSLRIANRMSQEGVNVIGVPKTIDNDLPATSFTFGFNTATQVATDAIDRLTTTAESHDRVLVVEVMGRDVGWIATYAGLAGGADAILIPEDPMSVEEICTVVRKRKEIGKNYTMVVVAEGAPLIYKGEKRRITAAEGKDEFGYEKLGGIGVELAKLIECESGHEARATVLGYVQRGGTPTAEDRVLSTRFGVAAVESINDGEFNKMVALVGNKIT